MANRNIRLKLRGTIADAQQALIADAQQDPAFENRIEEKTADRLVISTGGKHRSQRVTYEFKFASRGDITYVSFRVPVDDPISSARFNGWQKALQRWIDGNQQQLAA